MGEQIRIGSAASILGVSVDTLRRWEKDGRVTFERSAGGQRTIDVDSLRDLLRERAPQTGVSARNQLEGTVVAIDGHQAEVDVRGKRMRAKLQDMRVISGGPPSPKASTSAKATADRSAGQGLSRVRVHVDLKPREGMLSELKVIGMTVDEAIDRVSRFLDDTMVTDMQQVRIVHGHGTGALRKGLQTFLKTHPLVEKHYPAPDNQGGGGATIVELKD